MTNDLQCLIYFTTLDKINTVVICGPPRSVDRTRRRRVWSFNRDELISDYITRYGYRGMFADADALPIRNAFGELWRDLALVGLSLALGKIYSRYRKKSRFRLF